MTISNDIERLEEILAGLNYVVSLSIERVPVGGDCEVDEVIARGFPKSSVGDIAACSPKHAIKTLTNSLMYRGEENSHGPDNGALESDEFLRVFCVVRDYFTSEIQTAYDIHQFRFTNGHPHYPVFWDFSFVLRFNDHSNIWIGSSSD